MFRMTDDLYVNIEDLNMIEFRENRVHIVDRNDKEYQFYLTSTEIRNLKDYLEGLA